MITTEIILLVLLAYLTGAFPSAVWVGKTFYNTDVREYGSGNAGATNAFRTLGCVFALGVMLVDVLKSYLPVMFLKHYLLYIFNAMLVLKLNSIW